MHPKFWQRLDDILGVGKVSAAISCERFQERAAGVTKEHKAVDDKEREDFEIAKLESHTFPLYEWRNAVDFKSTAVIKLCGGAWNNSFQPTSQSRLPLDT